MSNDENHKCKAMNKVDFISIQKINEKWYLCFWDRDKPTAHGIAYCPYCGEKLVEDKE